MRFRWLHIVCLMMMLTCIYSPYVAASSMENDVQVDEQTRQLIMEKYGLEPPEESRAQHGFLSGDWGISFSHSSEIEPLDRLMQVVPFWLWPAVWIFQMWV
ncbi:hypothetical protein PAECIP112173_02066 [Paenibacillus sp. JJ-100]|uniref:hypothetical protein n=1 Tax=Paenibacillus sp. JJ-100 TaxID=2974896 RepID=UPI0022FF64DD|nr:hypothetical protein [Paenibacillus sp. JJ-100]CAI6068155.1 hypothetical protein PAECIP112173_02066 [Paenibacillus sp. JJ-100]